MADAASMFDPMSDAEVTTETKASHRGAGGDWTPIPPSAAAPDDFEHPKLGTPSIVWEYHNKSGELDGYQCRFDFVDDDGKPDKTFRPYRYGTLNGRTGWHWRGWGDKRPLYRLPDILARPDAQVRIFEGEKAADAAQVLFPESVTTTPMNGAKSPSRTDYKPLAGRTVVAWADNDEPGIEFAWEIERLALEAGAETVDVFQVPVHFPSGWDWADPMPEGWTTEKLLELPPASRPPMGETGGKKSRAGDEAEERSTPRLLIENCDPHRTVAVLRDILSNAGDLYDRGVPVRLAFDQIQGGTIAQVMTPDILVLMAHMVSRPYVLKEQQDGTVVEKDARLSRTYAVMYLDWRGEWQLSGTWPQWYGVSL